MLVPLFLVACGGSSSDGGSTSAGYAGTYSGTTVGVNGGPTTITVANDNTIKGTFTITNRVDESGAPVVYVSTLDGQVDANGKASINSYLYGAFVMFFSGQIDSAGVIKGTYYETTHPNDPSKAGTFSLQRSGN